MSDPLKNDLIAARGRDQQKSMSAHSSDNDPAYTAGTIIAREPGACVITPVEFEWWRLGDPCEDRFADLTEDYTNHYSARGNLPICATISTTTHLLDQAASIIEQCDIFLVNCVNSTRIQAVRQIKAQVLGWVAEYVEWHGNL